MRATAERKQSEKGLWRQREREKKNERSSVRMMMNDDGAGSGFCFGFGSEFGSRSGYQGRAVTRTNEKSAAKPMCWAHGHRELHLHLLATGQKNFAAS